MISPHKRQNPLLNSDAGMIKSQTIQSQIMYDNAQKNQNQLTKQNTNVINGYILTILPNGKKQKHRGQEDTRNDEKKQYYNSSKIKKLCSIQCQQDKLQMRKSPKTYLPMKQKIQKKGLSLSNIDNQHRTNKQHNYEQTQQVSYLVLKSNEQQIAKQKQQIIPVTFFNQNSSQKQKQNINIAKRARQIDQNKKTNKGYIKQTSGNEKRQNRQYKKVGFKGNNSVAQQALSDNDNKRFTTISIKCDDQRQPISKQSFSTSKLKSQQSSCKLISQSSDYRIYKIKSQGYQERMRKQVQIKDQLTQQKYEHLFKISNQNIHPNIVRMISKYKIVKDNKNFIIIDMPFYKYNLAAYLQENKSKEQSKVKIQRKIIIFSILKALHFLHSKNIYHRDLNPYNIQIGQNLQVAITNFAYAKPPHSPQYSQKNFYECNSFIRPPQIILQPLRPFDGGGDMWALGCMIVYMLKGEMPFLDYSDADIILQIIKILGRPKTQFLEKIKFKNNRRFIFPQMPQICMEQNFNCRNPQLLEIIRSVFKYDSQKRQKPQNLLASRYFNELKDKQIFDELAKQYNIQSLFDFQVHKLEQNKYNQIVPEWYRAKTAKK